MQMTTWHVIDNILMLKINDENFIVPSAKELYGIVFKNEKSIRGIDICNNLPDIQFSKFPVGLKVHLYTYQSNKSLELYLKVIAFNKDISCDILEFNSLTPDHLVIENIWYPFIPGDIDCIRNILNKAGINCSGSISLKQYLSIKCIVSTDTKIDDKISRGIKQQYNIDSQLEDNIPFFVGSLYSYQYDGYRWLKMIAREDAGCILGDQMGLGKTIQIIALLAFEKSAERIPSMVVTPPTLMENWRREILKFAPEINYIVHKGYERTGFHSVLKKYDVVITSYETVLKDLSMFKMLKWNILILDEAHFIKNPYAKRTLAIKKLQKRVAIAVTGTPVQNRLVDLWSIADFVLPGYLGKLKDFEHQFIDNVDNAEVLEKLISPVLLRRMVDEVAKDLPDRIDVPQAIEMNNQEAKVYEEVRTKIIEEYGDKASLVSLSKLRMYCTHPFLISKTSEDPLLQSTKYQRFVEILQEIIENNEKLLIFTSYSKMIDILVKDIKSRFGIHCDYIDGRVEMDERQGKIDFFEKIKESAVLVLNPRAAGVGLNVTAANHVIHYNLEWNPAVEDQASARAYRRGQTKPVTIHRLFYADTVEEIIDTRLTTKRLLSDAAVVGHDGRVQSYEDIIKAINISPIKGETIK